MKNIEYPQPTGSGESSMVIGLNVEANDETYADASAGIPIEKNPTSLLNHRATIKYLKTAKA